VKKAVDILVAVRVPVVVEYHKLEDHKLEDHKALIHIKTQMILIN
jgi:hypothetical protein